MDKKFVEPKTFQDRWNVSETFRVIVLFLLQHRGEMVSGEDIILIAHTNRRLLKFQEKRKTLWKEKSGRWWKNKKRNCLEKTKQDIQFCLDAGLITQEAGDYRVSRFFELEDYLK